MIKCCWHFNIYEQYKLIQAELCMKKVLQPLTGSGNTTVAGNQGQNSNLPHIKWCHNSDIKCGILISLPFGNFRWIKIWWVIFLKRKKINEK